MILKLKSLFVTIAILSCLCMDGQLAIDRSQTFGGSESEHFLDAEPTSDGGWMVLGYSSSTDQMVNCNNTDNSAYTWLLKLDSLWNIEWQQCYGDGGSLDDLMQWIEPDGSGGWVMFGYVTASKDDLPCFKGIQDLWLLHVDSMGNVLEQRCYGGSRFDDVRGFTKSQDGGYLVAARSYSEDGDLDSSYATTFSEDAWIFKLDSTLNIEWSTQWGGTSYDGAYASTDHPNGGYLAMATSSSDDGDVGSNYGKDDAWLLRLDDTGRVVWQKHYGGSEPDELTAIAMDGDSIIYMAGVSRSSFCQQGSDDYWVIKADTNGNVLKEQCFGGSSWEELEGMFLREGLVYLYGRSNSGDGDIQTGNYGRTDGIVMAIDRSLKLLWQQNYGGSSDDYIRDMNFTNEKLLGVGTTRSQDHDIEDYYGGYADAWILKWKETPSGLEPQSAEKQSRLFFETNQSLLVAANATNRDHALIIYNLFGVPVYSNSLPAQKGRYEVSLDALPTGIYVAVLHGEGNQESATLKFFKP